MTPKSYSFRWSPNRSAFNGSYNGTHWALCLISHLLLTPHLFHFMSFPEVSEFSDLCGPAHAAASTWNAFSLSSSWQIPTALLRPNATISTKKQHLTQSRPQLPHSTQLADCLCCTVPCCYSIFYFTQQLYTAMICFCVRLPVNCELLQGGLHVILLYGHRMWRLLNISEQLVNTSTRHLLIPPFIKHSTHKSSNPHHNPRK